MFDPASYHNGSIWPHDNSLIIEGLEKWGYLAEAQSVKKAILSAFAHFQTPIELFVYDEGYKDYLAACRTQAWSAAAIMKIVAKDYADSRRSFLSALRLKRLTSKALNWLFIYN
jgi:glycogen debranching enzyme